MEKFYIIRSSDFINMGKELLGHVGVSAEHAQILMLNLLDSDEKGIHTHGFFRAIPVYLKQLSRGNFNPQPNIQTIKDNSIVKLMDGDDGLGAVVGYYAMQEAIKIGAERGIGVVGVRNSTHFGAASYYAEMAAKSNQIGIVFSNAAPSIAPTGSLKPVLGNNPWSISVPTNLDHPITLDMANSVVARGKIRLAAAKGESIPLGWAVNKFGEPTTNAHEALEGAILPIGDYKGYGITLMVEILTGVLTGSNFGELVLPYDADGKRKTGNLFISLNIEAFMGIGEFTRKIDELVGMVKGAPKIKEDRDIMLPGEIEWSRKLNQDKDNLKVSEPFFKVMSDLCSAYEVNIPDHRIGSQ